MLDFPVLKKNTLNGIIQIILFNIFKMSYFDPELSQPLKKKVIKHQYT